MNQANQMNQMNQMNRGCQMQHGNYAANAQNCNYTANAQNCNYAANTQNCGCQKNSAYESMSQAQLLHHINEVSFAVDDVLLYLDTHPCDCEALAYCDQMTVMRNEAVKVYSRRFEPLTVDCTGECEGSRWKWIMQPWPWETMSKGGCR